VLSGIDKHLHLPCSTPHPSASNTQRAHTLPIVAGSVLPFRHTRTQTKIEIETMLLTYGSFLSFPFLSEHVCSLTIPISRLACARLISSVNTITACGCCPSFFTCVLPCRACAVTLSASANSTSSAGPRSVVYHQGLALKRPTVAVLHQGSTATVTCRQACWAADSIP
jgi:hypothetical protein